MNRHPGQQMTLQPAPDMTRPMRVHAVPLRDAPADEGAGASRPPLLSGALKDQALHLAGTLAGTLCPADDAGRRDVSLASGSAGLAVCSGQLARTRCDSQAADAALTRLEEAVAALATQPLTSSLYSGFTGIAWAVELVDGLLGAGGEDRSGDIDDALTSLLRRYPADAPYDLINGLTGLGVYALARWPRPGAAPLVLGVVAQLARQARHDRDGVSWRTPPSWHGPRREQYWPGGVDLGVAHGIAGVIPFLARVHRLGLARPTLRPLLAGAVRWLLAHLPHPAARPRPPPRLGRRRGKVPGCSRVPRASHWPWRPRRPRPNPSGTRCCSSPPRELPERRRDDRPRHARPGSGTRPRRQPGHAACHARRSCRDG